jgi:hypothetical protein
MKLSLDVRKKLKPFLEEYIIFNEGAFTEDGTLTNIAVKQSIQKLIKEEIFSKEELTRLILEETSVLIPVNVIDNIINEQEKNK